MQGLLANFRWICLIWLGLATGTVFADQRHDEYQVKAAFLYNIARFIAWPEQQQYINLCVLGENPFADALQALQDKSFDGRIFRLLAVPQQASAQCHIVFVSHSLEPYLADILDDIQQPGLLTVGDTDGYAVKGVMLNFYLDEQQRVRFEINLDAVRRAEIQMSSKLIRLGRIVQTE